MVSVFFFCVRRVRKATRVAEGARRSRARALPPVNVVRGLQPRNFGESGTVGNSENSPISRRSQKKIAAKEEYSTHR